MEMKRGEKKEVPNTLDMRRSVVDSVQPFSSEGFIVYFIA